MSCEGGCVCPVCGFPAYWSDSEQSHACCDPECATRFKSHSVQTCADGIQKMLAVLAVLREIKELTFEELIQANLSRVERWHSLESWSPLEWAGAMAGEAGEACNAAKKLKRVQDQIANHDGRLFGVDMSLPEQEALYKKSVGMECADAIIYSVLLCARCGVDLPACIKEAFNRKSEEYGFPERL